MNIKVFALMVALFAVQYAIGGWPPAVGSILGIVIAMMFVTNVERKRKPTRSKGEASS